VPMIANASSNRTSGPRRQFPVAPFPGDWQISRPACSGHSVKCDVTLMWITSTGVFRDRSTLEESSCDHAFSH